MKPGNRHEVGDKVPIPAGCLLASWEIRRGNAAMLTNLLLIEEGFFVCFV